MQWVLLLLPLMLRHIIASIGMRPGRHCCVTTVRRCRVLLVLLLQLRRLLKLLLMQALMLLLWLPRAASPSRNTDVATASVAATVVVPAVGLRRLVERRAAGRGLLLELLLHSAGAIREARRGESGWTAGPAREAELTA